MYDKELEKILHQLDLRKDDTSLDLNQEDIFEIENFDTLKMIEESILENGRVPKIPKSIQAQVMKAIVLEKKGKLEVYDGSFALKIYLSILSFLFGIILLLKLPKETISNQGNLFDTFFTNQIIVLNNFLKNFFNTFLKMNPFFGNLYQLVFISIIIILTLDLMYIKIKQKAL
jgi:hypothetical protein